MRLDFFKVLYYSEFSDRGKFLSEGGLHQMALDQAVIFFLSFKDKGIPKLATFADAANVVLLAL